MDMQENSANRQEEREGGREGGRLQASSWPLEVAKDRLGAAVGREPQRRAVRRADRANAVAIAELVSTSLSVANRRRR